VPSSTGSPVGGARAGGMSAQSIAFVPLCSPLTLPPAAPPAPISTPSSSPPAAPAYLSTPFAVPPIRIPVPGPFSMHLGSPVTVGLPVTSAGASTSTHYRPTSSDAGSASRGSVTLRERERAQQVAALWGGAASIATTASGVSSVGLASGGAAFGAGPCGASPLVREALEGETVMVTLSGQRVCLTASARNAGRSLVTPLAH
jgi:hypothetical protein